MGFGGAVQKAVYDALSADIALSAIVTGVYDNHPQPNDSGDLGLYPYVTIGEDVVTEWDTDTELGAIVTLTIHTWSRFLGRKETKEIQAAIYNALHRSALVVTGYKMVSIDWTQENSLLDPDGKTRHGIQNFKIILDQL